MAGDVVGLAALTVAAGSIFLIVYGVVVDRRERRTVRRATDERNRARERAAIARAHTARMDRERREMHEADVERMRRTGSRVPSWPVRPMEEQ